MTAKPAPHSKGEAAPTPVGWEARLAGPVLRFCGSEKPRLIGVPSLTNRNLRCSDPHRITDSDAAGGPESRPAEGRACWGVMPCGARGWGDWEGAARPVPPLPSLGMGPRQPAFLIFFKRSQKPMFMRNLQFRCGWYITAFSRRIVPKDTPQPRPNLHPLVALPSPLLRLHQAGRDLPSPCLRVPRAPSRVVPTFRATGRVGVRS